MIRAVKSGLLFRRPIGEKSVNKNGMGRQHRRLVESICWVTAEQDLHRASGEEVEFNSGLLKKLLFKLLFGKRTQDQLFIATDDLDLPSLGDLALDQRLG